MQTRVLLGQIGRRPGHVCLHRFWHVILVRIVDAVLGLRVNLEQETLGLDLSQHGEGGYIFF